MLGDDEDEMRRRWNKLGNPAPERLIAEAAEAGVARLLVVGCTPADSARAVAVAAQHTNVRASIGIHPHEAARYIDDAAALQRFTALASRPEVVAVGECGLDYFYNHSPKAVQQKLLRFQLELAQAYNLPMIFHVREAFSDFWPIFDGFPSIKGVIHSFTAGQRELQEILKRGLYVGLNGITTFMKDESQITAVKAAPLDRIVLETDAPFLTPAPDRATICTPKHVRATAEFLSKLRDEPLEMLANATTTNARQLFGLN